MCAYVRYIYIYIHTYALDCVREERDGGVKAVR